MPVMFYGWIISELIISLVIGGMHMKEGSLDAPIRHPLNWQNPDFLDADDLDKELRRVFDVCHGCRRCFNLCESFPQLFDLIDDSQSGELDSVASADLDRVVDACTLCDMCYMTKCPYVPPHEFNIDFPHLMLRHRALKNEQGATPFVASQLTKTDRNGKILGTIAPLVNWASSTGNAITRPVLESACGIHREATLPKFYSKDFEHQAQTQIPLNTNAPAFGRKAVLYSTCFVNYNNPNVGMAARQILALNGVETEVIYPECCGMPQLEQGKIDKVAESAKRVAEFFRPKIEAGFNVIALTPSCALMLKFEWPLILPENDSVKLLASATRDIDEYIVDIGKKEGLTPGLQPLKSNLVLHIACHSRAQNFGRKSEELLRHIPDIDITIIERCSGHGGSWGIMKDNFETAIKVGKPVARQARKADPVYIVSGCPLAAEHILQGMEKIQGETSITEGTRHPIEILAKAYGF